MKDNVIVGRVPRPFVVIAAERVFAAAAKNVQRARHAKVHDEHVAGLKIDEKIFRPPADGGHVLAFEPPREILWQRPTQIAAVHLDLGVTRAFHHWLETAAHRLDFGKFWHRSIGRWRGSDMVNFARHSVAGAATLWFS